MQDSGNTSQATASPTKPRGEGRMDIQRCFTVLDLDRDASPDEARRAYKDLVAIWHPDRFTGNPRLRQKAEEKLKEINRAYEGVRSHFASCGAQESGRVEDLDPNPGQDGPKAGSDQTGRGRTEEMAEAGTRMALRAWHYLTTAIRRFAAEMDEGKREGGSD